MSISNLKIVIPISLVLVAFGFFYFSGDQRPLETSDSVKILMFVNDETNESIKVAFDEQSNKAILYGKNYNGLVFDMAVSASGAKYENKKENMVLWNKSDDVVLIKNDKDIFYGVTSPMDDNLYAHGWVWKETIMSDDTIISPKSKGDFVINLSSLGQASISTDCNNVFGQYGATETKIKIDVLGSTKMYCENSQESVFLKQISRVDGYMFDSKGNLVLLLAYDSGSMMFLKSVSE